jgi:hypothetical protein
MKCRAEILMNFALRFQHLPISSNFIDTFVGVNVEFKETFIPCGLGKSEISDS